MITKDEELLKSLQNLKIKNEEKKEDLLQSVGPLFREDYEDDYVIIDKVEMHSELGEKLTEHRERVKGNMPDPCDITSMETVNQTTTADRFPVSDDFMELLNEVAGWEKVKKNTSIPVQNAARAFRLAKNDEEAANAMTELTKSCINYIEKNGGNIFKSGKRKKTVHAILSQIVGFTVDAGSEYMESLGLGLGEYNTESSSVFSDFSENMKSAHRGQNFDDALENKKLAEMRKHRDDLQRQAIEEQEKQEEEERLEEERLAKAAEEERLAKVAEEEKKLADAKKERDVIRDKLLEEEEQKRQERQKLREANKKSKKEEPEAPPVEEGEKEETLKPAPLTALQKKINAAKLRRKNKARRKARREINKDAIDISDATINELTDAAKFAAKEKTKYQKDRLSNNIKIETGVILTTTHKKQNAKRLSDSVNAVIDMKAKMRSAVSIDIKKKTDYLSFQRLSDIAYLTGGQAELEKLTNVYVASQKDKKKLEKLHNGRDNEEIFMAGVPALDLMTANILKLDVTAYDISSDEAIAKNAVELEKMARGVEAYKKLIEENGGEKYFEYLSTRKKKADEPDIGKLLLSQLDKLSAIAQYYRIRKLVIEDEGYINHEGADISAEAKREDDFETERLRKLLSRSKEYALQVGDAFRAKKSYSKSEFSAMNLEEGEIHRLEEQRYQVPPKWMREAFSMTNLKSTNEDKNAGFCCMELRAENEMYSFHVETEDEKNMDMHRMFSYDVKNKTKGKKFGTSPTFSGGKDDYLSHIDISDHWDRSAAHIENVFSYRRTVEEMREMTELLAIQRMPEWDTIKNDPEAVAYYESAYKEMAMKYLSAMFAAEKRVCETMGQKIMVMHPADLATQVSPKTKLHIRGALAAANVDTVSNAPRIKKLFSENNKDGRYLFDYEDYSDYCAMVSNAGWKSENSGKPALNVLNHQYVAWEEIAEDVSNEEVIEAIYGKKDPDSIRSEAKKLREEEIEKLQKSKDPMDREKLQYLKGTEPAYFWMLKHNELFSTKTYLTKTKSGYYVFLPEFLKNGRAYLINSNIEGLKKILDKGKVKPLKKEELDAYEKSLKERKMPGYVYKGDPYGIDLYRNHMDGLLEKDEKGNLQYDEKGKLKVKNILAMPEPDLKTGEFV